MNFSYKLQAFILKLFQYKRKTSSKIMKMQVKQLGKSKKIAQKTFF